MNKNSTTNKIHFLSAYNGKLELHNTSGLVCASNDPKVLATAFTTYGYYDSFQTSSSFDFGIESGFKTDDAVYKLFEAAFEIVNTSKAI